MKLWLTRDQGSNGFVTLWTHPPHFNESTGHWSGVSGDGEIIRFRRDDYPRPGEGKSELFISAEEVSANARCLDEIRKALEIPMWFRPIDVVAKARRLKKELDELAACHEYHKKVNREFRSDAAVNGDDLRRLLAVLERQANQIETLTGALLQVLRPLKVKVSDVKVTP